MQGVWRIKEAFTGVGEENERAALAQYENQIVTFSDSTMFLQLNIVGNHWYLSHQDSSTSPTQVDLSVRFNLNLTIPGIPNRLAVWNSPRTCCWLERRDG
ncbi:MAG: hypothetical protein ACK5N9_25385 [Pirellula sp.]